jgi:hypothetical protein
LLKGISMWIQLIAFISFISIPIYFPSFWIGLLTLRFESTAWTWLPLTWFAELGLMGRHGASWRLGWEGSLSIAGSGIIIWLGLRSFIGIYISEAVSMIQGGYWRNYELGTVSRVYTKAVRKLTGSPLGLGAFCFVSKMIRRDWQYRRTILTQAWLPFLIILLMILLAARGSAPPSPFSSSEASFIHIMPHILGLIAVALCVNLCFTDFHSSSWIYLISPVYSLRPFARGVYWALWIPTAGITNGLMLPFLIRFWGWKEATLAVGFSLIVVSLYLGCAMILISGLPFASPLNESSATKNVIHLQVCSLMVMAAPATLHWALFQYRWIAFLSGIILTVLTWLVVHWTLGELESAMRWKLHLLKVGANQMFEEIG